MARASLAALLAASTSHIAYAQDASGDAPPPDGTVVVESDGTDQHVYTPADFARFKPNTALDMLEQVPGFQISQQNQGRGLGQASENVLINGERIASKSDSAVDRLARTSATQVQRIEIVDGASFGIPGLSGQVANVIIETGAISGNFSYNMRFRPEFAAPSWGSGEVAINGKSGNIEWNAALQHGAGRGGAGDGPGVRIFDADDNLLETRRILIKNVGEYPRVRGGLKWDGPGSMVATINADYGQNYSKNYNYEWRTPVGDVPYFRDFLNRDEGYDYNISADVDFAFGPGRLKLIGIERFEQSDGPATSVSIYEDGRPDEGSLFYTDSKYGERIGRAEYRWDMLGGNWELDAEAAFNRLDREAEVGVLVPPATGNSDIPPEDRVFDRVPFPGGSGGVTEDRYEMILTHNRTLAEGLTLQFGGGAEFSRLSQTGTGGVTREFWRPKGSANLAWSVKPGLDVSLKLARTVGQLSFGQFLATVDLDDNNNNAGNIRLVPQQAWEANLELKKNLGPWGSATLRGYANLIDDYIDIVPVPGGESPGNIDGQARLYGIGFNGTFNLDPLGWKGAKLTTSSIYESTSLADPLTGEDRPFSGHASFRNETELRWDIPDSDWALGTGVNIIEIEPYVRLYETGRNWEGPVYHYVFVENKDVFGLNVALNVFNPTNGGNAYNERFVYTGLRDRSPLQRREYAKLDVSQIIRLTVSGNF